MDPWIKLRHLHNMAAAYAVLVAVYWFIHRRERKRKRLDFEPQQRMIKAMKRLLEAIEYSVVAFSKGHETPPTKEEDVWTHLVELGAEDENMANAYLFLTKKPDMLRALLGCHRTRMSEVE